VESGKPDPAETRERHSDGDRAWVEGELERKSPAPIRPRGAPLEEEALPAVP